MKYTLEQTNQMSWQEFGEICQNLVRKIEKLGIEFDAVAPILRNGMIPATVIANKLEILNIIPIHLKYFYNPTEIKLLLPIVKAFDLVDNPKILVVESNTSSGNSAEKTYDLLKEEFPSSELYYATVTRVFKKPQNNISMYKEVVWGVMTDEDIVATEVQKEEYSLRNGITIFPWETAERELGEINSL
jgi:hypoxanthine phosphoribosyltransferase